MRLAKWGIELEGGWDNDIGQWAELNSRPVEGAHRCWRGDGSVHVAARSFVGEWASPVYEYPVKKPTILELSRVWPDKFDESCGMHVHVSFDPNPLTIMMLADKASDFQAGLLGMLNKRGKALRISRDEFWSRLGGGNVFCRRSTNVDCLSESMQGSRYHVVNFESWHRHKTIEIRVLPMLPKPTALKIVRSMLYYVNRYVKMMVMTPSDMVTSAFVEEDTDTSPIIIDSFVESDVVTERMSNVLHSSV